MKKALRALLEKADTLPVFSIILGTGFEIDNSTEKNLLGVVSFKEAGFRPREKVDGHDYTIGLYKIGAKPILVFRGRLHLYEGYKQNEVIFPVELTREAGITRILLTSASGGLSDDLNTGDIIRVIDHINLTPGNPIQELSISNGQSRFVDLSRIYKNPFSDAVASALKAAGLAAKDGVIATMPGPIYETPAEASFLKRIGADLVSMSIAPEAIYAHYCGLETAAVSAVSNHHFKDGGILTHNEIMNKINDLKSDFNKFLVKLIDCF